MSITATEQSVAILNVTTDLPISKDATTSRVIVDNPLLRVIDFTFAAGQLLSEHTSSRAVVVTLLEGEMTFEVSGSTHTLAPGDVVYLAPHELHALSAVSDCRMQLVMVDVDAQ